MAKSKQVLAKTNQAHPECSHEGVEIYMVEYLPRALRDLEHGCAVCIAKIPGARRGQKITLG
jgi:hypothetical protein